MIESLEHRTGDFYFEELDLGSNLIEFVLPGYFKGFKNMKNLRMDSNLIQSLSFMDLPQSLKLL